jgi:hypothetical protein
MRTQNRPQVTRDTIIRFNRETIWVATGLLGTLVFAALALAFQGRQRKARQAESDFFPNANLATVRIEGIRECSGTYIVGRDLLKDEVPWRGPI